MKDKIKEILEELKDKDNYIEEYGYMYKRIALDDVRILLDYLTNLQTIEQQYSAILNENAELENKITNLEEIRKEHSIMKQFIYENGLWEKLLNDDRFLNHLRSDDNE